ncbi:hypothetical protein AB0H57_04580 [Micromonospora sp. NPDC050686]|uniref:hypothetical protein n=1 Tax=Micromonospora sp. NPDC050686 TaxID=3154631 RepID=UPI0033DE0A3F
MRPKRVLLMVAVTASALSVLAALVSAQRPSTQFGLAATAALVGYVLLADPAVRRLRPALAAGIGLSAVLMAVELWWLPEQADVRWFTPFYAPLDGSGPSVGPVQIPPAMLDQLRQMIDQERFNAVGLLLGVVCLAVAVVALPVRQQPKAAELARFVAVLLLAVVGANLWSRIDGAPLLGLLGAGWPAFLAILMAAWVVALSGARAGRAALMPLGALLVAVSTAVALEDLTGTWLTWWEFSNGNDHVMVEAAVAVSVASSADVSAAISVDLSGAVRTAMALAGPALLAVGALRASHDAG